MKYYMWSGNYEEVVDAPSPGDAAFTFLRRWSRSSVDNRLGVLIALSERGFESMRKLGPDNQTRFVKTQDVVDAFARLVEQQEQEEDFEAEEE